MHIHMYMYVCTMHACWNPGHVSCGQQFSHSECIVVCKQAMQWSTVLPHSWLLLNQLINQPGGHNRIKSALVYYLSNLMASSKQTSTGNHNISSLVVYSQRQLVINLEYPCCHLNPSSPHSARNIFTVHPTKYSTKYYQIWENLPHCTFHELFTSSTLELTFLHV